MPHPIRAAIGLASASAAALTAYATIVRPWHLRWGANDDDVARAMPLDERVPDPTIVSTRAIVISAPPERIWRWIVQMGESPRAGFYSYAVIERMQGMSIDNARRILPECQVLRVGDAIDRKGDMVVHHVEAGRALVLGPPHRVTWLRCTWAFELVPLAGCSTKLVTRVRAKFNYLDALRATPPLSWPFFLLIDPGIFAMERKMLLEIKRLAENEPASASGLRVVGIK